MIFVFINFSRIYNNGKSELQNCLRLLKKSVKYNIFLVFINFVKNFHEYIRTENPSYRIVWNYSKNHSKTISFCFHKFFKKCSWINYSKNHLNCFKYNIFCFHKFLNKFSRIYKNGKSELQNSLKSLKNHLDCFKYNIF